MVIRFYKKSRDRWAKRSHQLALKCDRLSIINRELMEKQNKALNYIEKNCILSHHYINEKRKLFFTGDVEELENMLK